MKLDFLDEFDFFTGVPDSLLKPLCSYVMDRFGIGPKHVIAANEGNAVGLAAGCIPVVGYNVGANRKDRVKHLFTLLLTCEAIVGAVAFIIVEFFPGQLIGVFGAANESTYYTEFAIKAFRTYLCMVVLATVNKGTFIYLQSVGKALASTMISLIREVVFGVGFALLLPRFFGLNGVLYSMPVSDVLTFIIAALVIRKTYQELSE